MSDNPASRQRILTAARTLFALHGFNGTTLRAVAAEAGCDVALIPHYFGNKQGLFDAATDLPLPPEALLAPLRDAPLERLGSAVARTFVHAWDTPEGAGMLAQLRSVLDDTPDRMLPLIDSAIWRHVRARLADEGVDEPELRVELALSCLIGAVTMRKFLPAPRMSAVASAQLVGILGPVLQHHLTGDLG
ncbi:TetR/AcrR family transcriptional regulator [Corynebacterium nasicanis]|uniref:TetR family transcriptional regulator n=1 Tax=Corynebacterium nasicanis TaxID=1448267 RepID=A0ABW1QAS4_9CORY